MRLDEGIEFWYMGFRIYRALGLEFRAMGSGFGRFSSSWVSMAYGQGC